MREENRQLREENRQLKAEVERLRKEVAPVSQQNSVSLLDTSLEEMETEKWANFYELRRLEEPEELEISQDSTTGGEENQTKVTVIEQFHKELSKQLVDPWREGSEEVSEEELKILDHVVKVSAVF